MPGRACSIPGCGRKLSAKQLCSRHYNRLRRYGDPLAGGKMVERGSLESRFNAFVVKRDGCWEWKGSYSETTYPRITTPDGQRIVAHRVSFELHKGEIPPGMLVDHICHNRGCTNPEHLRVVTHKQNMENYNPRSPKGAPGLRGVTYDKAKKAYRVQVVSNGRRYGTRYKSLQEAVEAARRLRNLLHTHNDADRIVNQLTR